MRRVRSVAMVSEHASPLAVLGSADAGGQNVHVAALARELAGQGIEVTVYTRRTSPEPATRVELSPGVIVHHLDAGPASELPKDRLWPYMDHFAEQLGTALRHHRPDIVHSHFWMSGYASRRVTNELGLPLVHTFHALGAVKRRQQGSADTSPPDRHEIEIGLARSADHVIATCSDEVFELARMGSRNDAVSVVPCGVDLDVFDSRTDIVRGDDRFRVAVVGRLVERKGVGNVIEAMAGLDDAILIVAGGPDAQQLDHDSDVRRLRGIAAEYGVSDRVEFTGRLDRRATAELMNSADVVVCAPWYEPFGIVPLEAMACGVPVVASATGGLIDSVVDGVTGIHVPPRCPELIGEALVKLQRDPELRLAMSRNGLHRARSRYGWPKIAAETSAVYERVVARRPSSKAGPPGLASAHQHLQNTATALASLELQLWKVESWSRNWAEVLLAGGRLLAAGNGGSAAEAQHLTAELVGRYRDDRRPFSALSLHAETSSFTAICNDYGADEVFARQVEAHGRDGDVLVLFSTSGKSPNLLRAAEKARSLGIITYALTGAAPNPLADACDNALSIDAPTTAAIQEMHLVALHVLCAGIDVAAGASAFEDEIDLRQLTGVHK